MDILYMVFRRMDDEVEKKLSVGADNAEGYSW